MPKNKIILVLGAVVALLPVLGFPRSWEVFFQVLAGLSIVILSVWVTIDKKLTLKAKAQQRLAKKTLDPQSDSQPGSPSYGRRVTDLYPKTGQPGRRLSDINPTFPPDDQERTN